MMGENDDGASVGLWVVIGIITLLLSWSVVKMFQKCSKDAPRA